MKSKTIILSSQDNKTSGRGILTLFEENGLLQCKLRLYNIEKLNIYCKIGVYHNNEVSSANLLEKNGIYTSSLVGSFDMEKDFYAAIIDTLNNNQVLISGGTYAGYFFNNESVFNQVEKEKPETNLFYGNSAEESHNPYEVLSAMGSFGYAQDDKKDSAQDDNFSDELKTKNEDLKTPENPCEDNNKCLNCKYKEYFYSHVEHEVDDNLCDSECCASGNEEPRNSSEALRAMGSFDSAQDYSEGCLHTADSAQDDSYNEELKIKTPNIKDSLIPQFQYVFENYEADETLNNLIPNSKFVKINEKKSQLGAEKLEQYSIGAIYDEDEMKYICYAVLCDYNTPAPQELGEHYQWLPLDKDDPLSEGYYIVFQDATDLKIVEL